MAISVPFSGGCACGAVRYQCSAEPLAALNCYCRDCQWASGSAFSANLAVPAAALSLTAGEVRYYEGKSERGSAVWRGFCSDCGSPILTKGDITPDHVGLAAASLDDPSGYRPNAALWTASAQPWAHLNSELPKFAKGASPEELQELLASRA